MKDEKTKKGSAPLFIYGKSKKNVFRVTHAAKYGSIDDYIFCF